MWRALLVLLALTACERDRGDQIEHHRHARVSETLLARVNADDVLDLVVIYEPTFQDPPGQRRSTLEAYDGTSGAVLWTTRLAGYSLPGHDARRSVAAIGGQLIVATLTDGGTDVRHDFELVIHTHDLATGAQRWVRQLEDMRYGHTFRVWPVGDDVVVNAWPRTAGTGAGMTALDLGTGTLRWTASIPHALDRPPIVHDGHIVVYELDSLVTIDVATGAMRTVAGRFDGPLLATPTALYAMGKNAESKPVLMEIDAHRASARTVMTFPDFVRTGPAMYGDLVVTTSIRGVTATRVGDASPAWTLDLPAPRVLADEGNKYAPLTSYFRSIPARYFPYLGEDHAIHVIDLETGTVTWTSKRLALHVRQWRVPFTVIGDHYYLELDTTDGRALVSFDGASGTFDGAWQVQVADVLTLPTLPTDDMTYPWSFAGRLVHGGYGRATWIVDLDAGRITMVHPALAATLIDASSLVTAALGPLPASRPAER